MAKPSSIAIGGYRFDMVGDKGHEVLDEDLSQGGPVSFSTEDWGKGLLTAENGDEHTGTPQYLSARGVDAAFPHQLIIQPRAVTVAVANGQTAIGSAPLKQVDFTPSGGSLNTYMITSSGRYVYKLSNGEWTVTRDLGVGLGATDIHVHGARLGIAYSSGFQHTADDSSWTTDNTDADRFGTLGATIWRVIRPNSAYSSTAFNGSWTTAYSIADSTYNINSIVGVEQLLLIGKEDGIYTLDAEGTVVPFTPELRPQANTNFAALRAAITFNGDYYFRTLNGVVQISAADGMKHRVGLDQLASPDLPTVVVQALAADDRYLYALCNNTGANLIIMRRSIGGSWHVFYADYTAGTKQGQHISVSGALGYPALFFSYYDNSSTYTTKYIRLSTHHNPLRDTSYQFDTTSQNYWIRLGRYGSADAPIIFDQCDVQSRALTASITVTPYYSVDGGAVTQFGSSSATASPLATIIPATPPSGHKWDFYLYLVTNDNTISPVVTGVTFKGWRRPARRKVHTFVISGFAHQETQRGGHARVDPVTWIANLDALRETNTYVTVTDENQQTFSGIITRVQRVTGPTGPNDPEPGHVHRVQIVESVATAVSQSYVYDQAVYS